MKGQRSKVPKEEMDTNERERERYFILSTTTSANSIYYFNKVNL
jgi:hypothetical protein